MMQMQKGHDTQTCLHLLFASFYVWVPLLSFMEPQLHLRIACHGLHLIIRLLAAILGDTFQKINMEKNLLFQGAPNSLATVHNRHLRRWDLLQGWEQGKRNGGACWVPGVHFQVPSLFSENREFGIWSIQLLFFGGTAHFRKGKMMEKNRSSLKVPTFNGTSPREKNSHGTCYD